MATGALTNLRRRLHRVAAPAARSFVRRVPPRGRGWRVVELLERRLRPEPGRLFPTREPSGVSLSCDLTNALERAIYYRGYADREVERWIRGWLRPGDVAVDVGAHIGSFASLALELAGDSGSVIALEPHSSSFERLRTSFEGRANVTLHRCAAGAASATRELFEPAGADMRQADVATLAPAEGFRRVGTTEVRRLDDLLAAEHVIRLLKIDVEGFEPDVLDGASAVLGEGRVDAVLVELNPDALARNHATPKEVLDGLAGSGYEPFACTAHGLEPFAASSLDHIAFVDVVCIRANADAVDLSVVVPTHGGAARVRRHLPKVREAVATLGVLWEGVVVDDCSPAPDAPSASDVPPSFRLLALATNCGAAAARNAGARRSRGQWLLFVDDDVELDPASLATLWRVRRDDECLVPEVRTPDGTLQNAMVRTSRFFEPRWRFETEPQPDVDYPLGACFLVPRDVFERAGGLDERFKPNYFEDTAFGEALRRAGSHTRLVEGAVARHYEFEAERAKTKMSTRRRAIHRNRWRYVIHYTSGGTRILSLALAPVRIISEAVRRRTFDPIAGWGEAVIEKFVPPSSG